MPDFYSDRVAIRAPGHSTRVYASVFVGAEVASGTVAGIVQNDAINVTVTVTDGDLADARYGFEVVFFNSAGEFKLRTHIRFAGTISSTNLPIRELSYGTAQLGVGDLWTVYRELRLHDKLVSAVGTPLADAFAPDYLTYSDQGLHPSPVACSGGAYATWVDGYLTQAVPETYATVEFTGSTSYVIDPNSLSTITHAWRFPAGSTPTTSTSANPSVQIPVGSWLVEHDVTDVTNGKTTTQYVPVMVHDASFMPYEIQIDSGLQSDEQYGWRYTVRLFQDATLADIPDGALVILWTRERINGAWQSFRNAAPGRETILAVGYAHRDTNTAEAAIRKVFFDVVSPLQRLDEIAGYSKVMDDNATPDAWSKLAFLSTKRAKVQLVYYYTTLVEAGFDWLFDAGYLNYLYPALYLQRSTPIGQLRELAHSVDARITCDRTGRFNVYTHPAYIPLADRAAVTVTFILAAQDIIDLEFAREHFDVVERMKVAGLSAQTSPLPYFSLYPGDAPNEAAEAQTRERLILGGADPQVDINERAGRYGALANNDFINADGFKQRAFELRLTLFGAYDFFDFYKEYVQFSLTPAKSNLRGVDLSTFRFWLKAVSVEYLGGTARTRLVLQSETNAPAGATFTQPTDVIPPTYNPPPYDPTPYPPILKRGTSRIALWQSDSTMRQTSTFTNAVPAWTSFDLTALSGWNSGDVLLSAVQKAFAPDTAWLAGEDKIYLQNSIASPSAVTAQYTFPYAWTYPLLSSRFIQTERCHPAWAMCATWDADLGGMRVAYTTNGTTWNEGNVGATGTNTTVANSGFVWMSGRTPGLARVGTFSAATTEYGTIHIYETRDFGATWTQGALITSAGRPPQRIEVPYADESVMYVSVLVYNGVGFDLLIKQVVGAAVTDVSPTYMGDTYGAAYTLSLRTWDADASKMLLIGNHNSTDVTKYGAVFTSSSGILGLTNVIPPATGNLNYYLNGWIGGDGLATYIAGAAGHIAYSDDFLATALVDRTGTGIGTGITLNLCGWN